MSTPHCWQICCPAHPLTRLPACSFCVREFQGQVREKSYSFPQRPRELIREAVYECSGCSTFACDIHYFFWCNPLLEPTKGSRVKFHLPNTFNL